MTAVFANDSYLIPGESQAKLGLGPLHPAGNTSKSLWVAWEKPYYGLFLRRAALQGEAESAAGPATADVGSISFGRIDETHADGDPQWLEADALWSVGIEKISLNGVAANMSLFPLRPLVGRHTTGLRPGSDGTQGKRLVTINSMTNYIGLPGSIVDALMSNVSGALKRNRTLANDNSMKPKAEVVWTVPCDAQLDLKVTLNGTEYTMDAQDLTSRETNGNCTAVFASIPPSSHDGPPSPYSVPWLGLSFLRTVYSVWDPSVPRIGFAMVKDAGAVLNATSAVAGEENGGKDNGSGARHAVVPQLVLAGASALSIVALM